MSFDLHLHSVVSDGVFTPSKLVELAYEKKLTAISITDHDTVAGIKEALNVAEKRLLVIPGVEISCLHETKDIHILGYFIDYESTYLNQELDKFNNIRIIRAGKMAQLLQSFGIKISLSEILQEAHPAAPGRAHVARLLVRKGVVADNSQAFEDYLKRGKCCYVPKAGAAAQDSINLIKESGGLASLAHPLSSELQEDEIKEIKEMGLDAIEVFHPEQNKEDKNKLLSLSKKLNLLVTGGSDFHGYYRKNKALEFAQIEDKYLDELIKKSKK